MRLRLLFTQRRQGVLDEAAALKALCRRVFPADSSHGRDDRFESRNI